jgi:cbb3-type cytochrome oxidase maturation protein
MEALFLLVPLSVIMVFVALWVFFSASDGGQFDDLVGPGMRVLQDDDSGAPAAPPSPVDAAQQNGDATH